MFLVHYIGDMTQPLHVCKRDNGGNGARAVWNPRQKGNLNTNMHVIWDKLIIQKRLREDFSRDLDEYGSYLFSLLSSEIMDRELKFIKKFWDSYDEYGMWNVAVHWAQVTNSFNCENVWDYYDRERSADLSGRYYLQARETVDQLLAIAGFRIATLLNGIVETYVDTNNCYA